MRITLFLFHACITLNTIAMEQHNDQGREQKRRASLVEQVKKLVAQGLPSNDNLILFTDVIPSGSVESLELLLKNKINCELPGPSPLNAERTCTPLISAIIYSQIPMVKLFLKCSVAVNATDEDGCTPLVSCLLLRDPQPKIVALLLQASALDLKKLVPWAQEGEGKMMTAYEIAKEEASSAQSLSSGTLFGNLKESTKQYRTVGRMLLARLRFDSHEGRVAHGGLRQTGLPADILKKIAASVDYEAVEKEFKL